jgi:hypothetical protein
MRILSNHTGHNLVFQAAHEIIQLRVKSFSEIRVLEPFEAILISRDISRMQNKCRRVRIDFCLNVRTRSVISASA